MVEDRDEPLSKGRLHFEVRSAAVKIDRIAVLPTQGGDLVYKSMPRERLANPTTRVPVTVDRGDAVPFSNAGYISHCSLKISRAVTWFVPRAHHVLHDPTCCPRSVRVNNRERKRVGTAAAGVTCGDVPDATLRRQFVTSGLDGALDPHRGQKGVNVLSKLGEVLASEAHGIESPLALQALRRNRRVHQRRRCAPHEEIGVVLTVGTLKVFMQHA